MRRPVYGIILLSVLCILLTVSCSRSGCVFISDPIFSQVILSEGLREEIEGSGVSCRYLEYQDDSENLWLDRESDDSFVILSPSVSKDLLDGGDERLVEYIEQQQRSGRVFCLDSEERKLRLEDVPRFEDICFITGDLASGWADALEAYQDQKIGILAFSSEEAQSTIPGMFPLGDDHSLYIMGSERVSRGQAQQALVYMAEREVEILFVLLAGESLDILSEMSEYDMLAVIEHGRYTEGYQDMLSGSVEYDYAGMIQDIMNQGEDPCTTSLDGVLIQYEQDSDR